MGPLKATWPPLIQEDRELVLKTVQYARDSGLLTDVTALSKLDLVDSPEDEVEAANEESAQRVAAAFPDGTSAQFQARLGQDVGMPDETDQPGDEMPAPDMNT